MPAFFAPVIAWLLREIVIKFIVFTTLFALMAFLVPKVTALALPFLDTTPLGNAFAGLSSSVWFFLDFFQIGFGVKATCSAYVTRFLIRRIPVIG